MIKKLSVIFLNPQRPEYFLMSGYVVFVLIGSTLLYLPSCQSIPTSFLDCLFTATSALSTTGLTTVSTSDHFTHIGEWIVLLLMQTGGIGYMSIGSIIIFGIKRHLFHNHMQLIQIDYHLPKTIEPMVFIKRIILFSLTIEMIGASLLFFIFLAADTPQPVWNAIFHSVSAFCTAGFSLFNNSFEDFYANIPLNGGIAALAFTGAMGFIVLHDFFFSWADVKHRVTNTTKAILITTLGLYLFTHIVLIWTDPTIYDHYSSHKIIIAFFQSMTAMTTVGFNTVPIHTLIPSSIFLLILVMIIGASPTGTVGLSMGITSS